MEDAIGETNKGLKGLGNKIASPFSGNYAIKSGAKGKQVSVKPDVQAKFSVSKKISIPRLKKTKKTIIFSAIAALLVIVFGFSTNDIGVIGNTVIIATFIIATPQLMIRYSLYRDLKEAEDRFPTFLRNLTETIRSGMPFHKSIIIASKGNYGTLNDSIKKMANQITWGIPLEKVLDKFADRLKNSRRIYTATKIIKESYNSGGNVVSILDSVADNLTILNDAEKEKKSTLSQYVMLMYAISFIFIGIVVSINNLLIPIFNSSAVSGEILGLENPCDSATDFSAIICGIFEGTSKYVFGATAISIGSYYTSLFFLMALVQSLFSGLVAGQLSEGSVSAGIKHSLILVAVTFGAFSILIRLGLLGI